MTDLVKSFRENIQKVEAGIKQMIESGEIEDKLPDCTLKHYFTPIGEYGCCNYAREMTIPAGTLVIGKIHRHEHLNIISKGRISVATEHGTKYLIAPCTFISEVGLKRAVVAEEDTIWTTIHMVSQCGEEYLKEIEDEVIAPSYEALTSNLIEGEKL
jgi:hypothetical protein